MTAMAGELRTCDVHRLVNHDFMPRISGYCNLCDAWICQECAPNWPKRFLAAAKRKLEPGYRGLPNYEQVATKGKRVLAKLGQSLMGWITVIDESANSLQPQVLLNTLQQEHDFPPPAAGITVVQHRSKACSGAATCALAFTSNNASGNLLVYMCSDEASSSALNAATDNNTNTIANATSQNTTAGQTRIDYVSSSHSGANTVTCNAPLSQRIHIHIWEISGTTGTKDQSNTGSQAATSQSISTSGATTASNEVVFGFFYDQPNDDSLTAGTGYSPSEFVDGGAGLESSLSEVKIVSSTGTQTATATCGSGTNSVLQTILTFK